MDNEELDLIEMMDDEGNKLSYEHLLTFEVENDFFIAITPVEDMEDFKEGEVLIMRVNDDGEDGEVYTPIESEEELNSLWEIFQQLYYEDDEDGCCCEDCGDNCDHEKH
ncbi:hypothetical protein SDC9_210991 [bioreactor metagenome]|uniref:Uncharacterized protein n=1 Tax=bioreactor metagenome TaxID=1076179 RepID=A0A645JTA6_9ZZZZ